MKKAAGKTNPDIGKINQVLAKYKGNKGALIPVLQEVQVALGFLSQDSLRAISEGLVIPLSQIYGVATFYTQLRLKPIGKHLVRVCHGTACHVGGAEKVSVAIEAGLNVKDGETTADRKFTVESVACLGCCSLAPVMMVDNDTFGRLTPESAIKAVKEY
jgi:NADH-quinone oxidoreductase subunit E